MCIRYVNMMRIKKNVFFIMKIYLYNSVAKSLLHRKRKEKMNIEKEL
jgi:hypothetical protein